jgi:short subunit dehydrogenase-like uncharacterized protein
VPTIVADAADPASLEAMVKPATKCVITTVGPYQLYGEPLLAACAAAGTDYLDLSGEPVVDGGDDPALSRQAAAKASGARILFSCGFDSIPFELGVFYTQMLAQKHLGHPSNAHQRPGAQTCAAACRAAPPPAAARPWRRSRRTRR